MRARRLHAADGQQRHPRHQRSAVHEAQLTTPRRISRRSAWSAPQPNILVVNPTLPVNTVAELIALAKQQPGQAQLRQFRLRRRRASLGRAVQVRGAGRHRRHQLQGRRARAAGPDRRPHPADVRDLRLGGRPHQGRPLRPLAVTTLKRFSLMPDLPTVAELGLPGFDATTWHGLVAPAATPKDASSIRSPRDGAGAEGPGDAEAPPDLGVEVGACTPEEFAAYIKSEIPKWAAVVKASGAQVE